MAAIATLGSNNAAQAAMAATTTIPIVFSTGGDAVEAGLVRSMSLPGGNVTGVMTLANLTNPKRLELLAKLVPQATTIYALVIQRSDNLGNRSDQLRAAARALGREAVVLEVRGEHDFEAAFATFAHVGPARCSSASIRSSPRIEVSWCNWPHVIGFRQATRIGTLSARAA